MVLMTEITSSLEDVDKDIGSKRSAQFEQELFREGKLHFNFDDYAQKTRRYLKKTEDFCQEGYFDENISAEMMAREYEYAYQGLVWRQRFSGEVPKSWDIWYNTKKDFEKAKEEKVRLSSKLIDAGITYPHHIVALEVAKSQILNLRQLTWVFVRPDLPGWARSKIFESQLKKGVNEETIEAAKKKAEEVREKIRKERERKKSLHSSSELKRLPNS